MNELARTGVTVTDYIGACVGVGWVYGQCREQNSHNIFVSFAWASPRTHALATERARLGTWRCSGLDALSAPLMTLKTGTGMHGSDTPAKSAMNSCTSRSLCLAAARQQAMETASTAFSGVVGSSASKASILRQGSSGQHPSPPPAPPASVEKMTNF